MECIRDIKLLIAKIDEGLEMRRAGRPEASDYLDSFYFAPSVKVDSEIMSFEPGSEQSYSAQMRCIYEPIAGHAHNVMMEGLEIASLSSAKPFPFNLAPEEAGYWTMAYGYFVKCLRMQARGRVLEIGFGPGGLTELLVRSGLDVTALDVRQSNCSQFGERMKMLGEAANILCCDVDRLGEVGPFDVVIFYESFHHMPSPRQLLKKLASLLSSDGRFLFGAEPIQPPGPLIPYPWGFRMNGGSLGAIRDVGWVEFGFQEDFFCSMLGDLGFSCQREYLPGFNHCDVWTARRNV